jgi:DNA-binding HxlR family transcriptional regulator
VTGPVTLAGKGKAGRRGAGAADLALGRVNAATEGLFGLRQSADRLERSTRKIALAMDGQKPLRWGKARRTAMMGSGYDLRCPVARTLDIIGERWTILILRDLLREGPRRFQDFQSSLAGLSPNTLSARLKALERHGIVARRLYEEHPPRAEYALTEKGRTLGPILKALLEWGTKHAQ